MKEWFRVAMIGQIQHSHPPPLGDQLASEGSSDVPHPACDHNDARRSFSPLFIRQEMLKFWKDQSAYNKCQDDGAQNPKRTASHPSPTWSSSVLQKDKNIEAKSSQRKCIIGTADTREQSCCFFVKLVRRYNTKLLNLFLALHTLFRHFASCGRHRRGKSYQFSP